MNLTNAAFLLLVAIGIVSTIIVYGSLLVSLPDKKRMKNRNVTTKRDSIVTKHNDIVSKLSEASNEFTKTVDKLKLNIALANDGAAFERLKYFADEYIDTKASAEDYLTRSLNCIGTGDYYGSEYCLDETEKLIEAIKKLTADIQKIEVTENVHFKTEEIEMSVSNKNYSVFFENIDTKEALNIRYKKLAKVFHPDNENGDRETFEAIKEEYNRLIKDMR